MSKKLHKNRCLYVTVKSQSERAYMCLKSGGKKTFAGKLGMYFVSVQKGYYKNNSASLNTPTRSLRAVSEAYGLAITRGCVSTLRIYTSWWFPPENKLFFMFFVIHSDGKTRSSFGVFNVTVIFTAAIHRVHAPVETYCFEAHLLWRERWKSMSINRLPTKATSLGVS